MSEGSLSQSSSAIVSPFSSNKSRFAAPRLLDPLIERHQLLAQLKDLRGRICLLLGAAGSGKTCALVGLYQALHDEGDSRVWLSLDETDNTPQTLRSHLKEAFARNSASGRFVFIDGGEKLTQAQAWSELESFLLNLPEDTTAFVTAQTMRRSALYDAWLRGVVSLIGPDQLHMSGEEAAALLPSDFSEAERESALRFTQAWPAGLRFLARDPAFARGLAQNHRQQDLPLPATLSRYFEDVVLERLTSTERHTLTILAVLERFTPAMLPALPPPHCDWNTVQALIHEQNYLHSLDSFKTWITVQPALGQFLRTRLRHSDPARYESLKEFSAAWCADNGFPAEAVRHAAQLADPKRAAEIIERAGAINVELGNGPDIDLALDLPPQRARDLPLLFFSQIYLRIRHGRHRQARMAYDKACELTNGFKDIGPNADPKLVDAWALLFKIILASIDDVPVPDTDLRCAEHFMIECLDAQPVMAASLASVIAWGHIENGNIAEASRICQMAMDPHAGKSLVRVSLFLHVHWVSVLMMHDTVSTAIAHIEQAQMLAQVECGADSYEVLIPQLKRGILHYEQDELEQARACLTPALARVRTISGWVRIYGEAITTAVLVETALGNHEAAEAQLRAGEQFADVKSLSRLSAILASTRAERAIAQGDFRSAQNLLQSCPLIELIDASTSDGYRSLATGPALLTQALLQLELKRPREALETLERATSIFPFNPDARLRFTQKVLAMRAHFELRRYNGAVEHLLDALSIAQSTGLVRRARNHRNDLLDVYEWAKRNGKTIAPKLDDFICDVLGARGQDARELRAKPARDTGGGSNLTLSPREAEIMTLVAEGLSAKEIALRLGISEGTVKSHRKKIHGKLGVSTRSQAIHKARELLII